MSSRFRSSEASPRIRGPGWVAKVPPTGDQAAQMTSTNMYFYMLIGISPWNEVMKFRVHTEKE